jgi:hypothetical protein
MFGVPLALPTKSRSKQKERRKPRRSNVFK